MNSMMRWDPFREMDELQGRLFCLLGRPVARSGATEAAGAAEWAPPVDIVEDDKEYMIKVDLPDISREDLKVVVENGILSVSGERRFEKEEKNRRYHRVERAYGRFLRRFGVPEDADPSKVNADFRDGILKVRIAKDEKTHPKSIEVKVA